MASLQELRDAIAALDFPPLSATDHARTRQRQLVFHLDDHILPRTQNLEGPLLAVVGGSTGAGKSTLVNGIVGEMVTDASVIRPTTRRPVLVTNPADQAYFSQQDAILPGLTRVAQGSNVDPWESLQLVTSTHWLEHLGLLDAPDVDSVVQANRELAQQLLTAADMWIFVTTAMRYADAVAWEYLIAAAARDITVAVVINRIPPAHEATVVADLRRLLAENGLQQAQVFPIAEAVDGTISASAVADLRAWLTQLAADREQRLAVVQQTLAGSIRSVIEQTHALVNEIEGINAEIASAEQLILGAQQRCVDQVAELTRDGTLLRGEVLSRWQDLVGTTDLFRALESRIGWLRDRITASLFGRGKPVQPVEEALESGLTTVCAQTLFEQYERLQRQWRDTPFSPAPPAPDVTRIQSTCRDLVARWQAELITLLQAEGAGKRAGARIVAIGVNVLAVALMLVIFASTGGLTGAELGVAGASAVVAQRLLEAVFGDQAVRMLATKARQKLLGSVAALAASEFTPFAERVAAPLDYTRIDAAVKQVGEQWV